MCGFWSTGCFSLKTQYQQHNLQSLWNKRFCLSIVSFGSPLSLSQRELRRSFPSLCREAVPSSGRAHESQTGDGGWPSAGSAVQPRVPGVALVDERGARSVRAAAPRRGPRLPRGSTTVTAAGGVGGPGAVGSGRGRISQPARRRKEGGKVKQRGEDKKVDAKRKGNGAFLEGEYWREEAGKYACTRWHCQINPFLHGIVHVFAQVWIDKLSSLIYMLLTLPKCKALNISKHFTELSKNHVHSTGGRK